MDGKLAGWQEAGAGLAEEQAASSEHLSTVLARRAQAHTSAPASLSPPKPGESPRGSYAIVGKGSNYGGNATGVTHASTGSCGVRSEITHVRISPIPAPPGAALRSIPPCLKELSPPPRITHTPGPLRDHALISRFNLLREQMQNKHAGNTNSQRWRRAAAGCLRPFPRSHCWCSLAVQHARGRLHRSAGRSLIHEHAHRFLRMSSCKF